ncbi:CAF17-like 4Fe-4S cluster assembly/insertion protein YgfZ [Caenimonas soli]|uniref:CAF17-like 4Fe-4S cluster assembly/insertion protein YgfZ n=1 Tax=Caenimonas soli TaxID=2735555 RepID=UPI0015516F4A|nr:folate-binding protein YgfZ [Caenimonas soli]NPC54183.1 folate-binding protein YgfZ [Caenimonas soli]
MSHPLNGVTTLPQLGIIGVQGDDAASFLQGQLTQDFALLGLSEARLAAYCTAKGRMQASFIGFKRAHGDILLVVSRDVLAPTLKRLSMFVLRAKAKLRDATAEFDLYGAAGDAAKELAPGLSGPWSKVDVGSASVVSLYPADGQARALWLVPAGEAAPQGPSLSHELWLWGEVRSGITTITAPVAEAFVPQMLNYESVGGVNFKKGCYPGQEVVARSQFRGTLKKRAYLAHSPEALHAGQEIFHESDPGQPCGLVAQAAPAPGGGWDAIVSIQITASQGGGLAAGGPEGPAIRVQAPPYPLLADV